MGYVKIKKISKEFCSSLGSTHYDNNNIRKDNLNFFWALEISEKMCLLKTLHGIFLNISLYFH